jgi:hypothetical protein
MEAKSRRGPDVSKPLRPPAPPGIHRCISPSLAISQNLGRIKGWLTVAGHFPCRSRRPPPLKGGEQEAPPSCTTNAPLPRSPPANQLTLIHVHIAIGHKALRRQLQRCFVFLLRLGKRLLHGSGRFHGDGGRGGGLGGTFRGARGHKWSTQMRHRKNQAKIRSIANFLRASAGVLRCGPLGTLGGATGTGSAECQCGGHLARAHPDPPRFPQKWLLG